MYCVHGFHVNTDEIHDKMERKNLCSEFLQWSHSSICVQRYLDIYSCLNELKGNNNFHREVMSYFKGH